MPGQNLTREEAATRADLIAVHSYDVVLDLATGPTTFATRSTVRFSRGRGAETFVDFVGESVESVILNGVALDPASQWVGLADRAAGSRRRERARRRGHRALHEHRRGDAPVRRPGRRRGLPLQPVRGAGLAPGLRGVRAARPQGHVRVHRHGARPLDGPVRLPHAGADARRRPRRHRARDVGLRADPGALLLRHRPRRPGPTSASPTPSRAAGGRSSSGCMRVARSSSTSTPTTSST